MLRSVACRHLILLCVASISGLASSFAPRSQGAFRRPSFSNSGRFVVADGSTAENSSSNPFIDVKEQLLAALSYVNSDKGDGEPHLPCGLACSDDERAIVSAIVAKFQKQPENLIETKNGKIEVKDMVGEWDLLYTSSRTMIINKSLSGLGRSTSEMAKIASIRHKLTGSKYQGFVEYVEHYDGGPDADGFDVVVTGEWELQDEYDPFTTAPTTAIRLDLEKLVYGPTTNDAETWPSLGPIRLLDIVYLSDDLQIARGNVNPDAIFVFQRV